jgi:flagellar biosynthesis anti-sigma factor FlgM
MKVNNPNLPPLVPTGTSKANETDRTGSARSTRSQGGAATSGDDVHLSELVRSLRSLASDSPERQAKIEALTKAVADGRYQADSQKTASKVIDDAIEQ